MAQIVAVIASTHHPFYLKATTAPPDERPPFADEWERKVLAFRETLTAAAPDVLVMVGSDHFHQLWLDNMPQFLVGKAPFYDGNFYQRGARVRPAADADGRRRAAQRAHPARRPRPRLRPRVQQRAADRPQHHVPDHHAAPAGRPADRSGVHEHLRAAAAPAAAVRRAGPDAARARRGVAQRQAGGDHRDRSPLARARRPAAVRSARPRPAVRRPGRGVDRERRPRRLPRERQPRPALGARQRHPRVHGLHADDGRRGRGREGRLRRHVRPLPHDGGVLHLVPRRRREPA